MRPPAGYALAGLLAAGGLLAAFFAGDGGSSPDLRRSVAAVGVLLGALAAHVLGKVRARAA